MSTWFTTIWLLQSGWAPTRREAPECRWTLVGAEVYLLGVTRWTRLYITTRPGPWPVAERPLGCFDPQQLHLYWTIGLRGMEVQCWLPPQCHQGPIDQGAPSISTVVDANGSPGATWKSVCLSSRMKTRRMLSPIKAGIGINWCILKLCAKTAPSILMSFAPYRATWGSWWGAWSLTSLWRAWSLGWISTTTMSRPLTPWTRSFSNYKWLTKKQCQIGVCTSQGIFRSFWPPSWKGSHQTILLIWSETTSMGDT